MNLGFVSAYILLGLATGAVAYAGAEDIPSITVPRAVTAVANGDAVFGLRIVTTPGHTLGSISALDPAGGFLVAGDALRSAGGQPTLPGADFTVDMALAKQSIVKLGDLVFETLLSAMATRSKAERRRRSQTLCRGVGGVRRRPAASYPPYVAPQNLRRGRAPTRSGKTPMQADSTLVRPPIDRSRHL